MTHLSKAYMTEEEQWREAVVADFKNHRSRIRRLEIQMVIVILAGMIAALAVLLSKAYILGAAG